MTSGDIAAWASLIVSIFAGAAAVVVFVSNGRRDRRTAVSSLHVSLTSGEIAAARHIVGNLLYSNTSNVEGGRSEAISAYFILIWAMQRSRNVFRIYKLEWRPLKQASAVPRASARDVMDALTWNLSEIAENLSRFHEEYGERWSVDDADAWDEMREFFDRNQFITRAVAS